MTLRASMALAAALSAAACATPLMKLPPGLGAPSADAGVLLDQALTTCRSITSLTANVAVSGHAGRRKLRARLSVGVSAPAAVYLEAPAPFGAPFFVLAAIDDDATLWLPRDRRVLEHGRPADVLEAIAGVPLGPRDFKAALTGCATDADATGARKAGDDWRVVPGEHSLYLHRARAPEGWRLVAVVHRLPTRPEWRTEYRSFLNGTPRAIRLASTDPGGFALQLDLTDVEINVPLDVATFRPRVPAGTDPMTIEELRDSGPLADRASTAHE